MLKRFRAWNHRRLELKLADLEAHRSKWGWSYKPSREADVDRRIEKLEAKVAKAAAHV